MQKCSVKPHAALLRTDIVRQIAHELNLTCRLSPMLVETGPQMTDTATDTVVLSFPRATKYYSVARLVVGGMAAPLQMSYDALDDLQLAISSLLDRADLALHGDDVDVQLHLEVSDSKLVAKIGGFASGDAGRALDPDVSGGEVGAHGLGLRRLLDTIVDDVSVEGGSDGEWVTLVKHVKANA